jgi:hypothetical protein
MEDTTMNKIIRRAPVSISDPKHYPCNWKEWLQGGMEVANDD